MKQEIKKDGTASKRNFESRMSYGANWKDYDYITEKISQ